MAYARGSAKGLRHFYLISVNYNKADTAFRGRCGFSMDDDFLKIVRLQNVQIPHFFALSTCNRTEIYAFARKRNQLIDFFCRCAKLHSASIEACLTIKEDQEAIDFLFRVGAGLESQIIGDFEIIGQIKKWFNFLKKFGFIDCFLERLLNAVIQASKRIKSETHLSTGAASVAYAAVRYILKEIPEVSSKNILLHGLGKIGRNVCENLLKHTDHKHITLINRTYETARSLASERLLIKPYEQLQVAICEIDILIVATSAPSPVILSDMFSNRRRSLLILDLSIPENVDPLVREIPGIHLLNVDALSQQADETIDQRKKEIPKAEIILDEVKKEFFQWLSMRRHARAIHEFKNYLTEIYNGEINRHKKKNPGWKTQYEPVTRRFIQKITDHFARHIFIHEKEADKSIALIGRIFDLKSEAIEK